MGPVLWVSVRPDATARELASLSADLRHVTQKVAGPSEGLPVILLVDGDGRPLMPLGPEDPLGRGAGC